MSKVTMPEPVAWGIYNPTLRSYELSKEKVETKYRDDGTVVYGVVPFITTDQAEAYAAAKVREAQQWKPIETAPQGTICLFYNANAAEVRGCMFVDWVVDGTFCGNRFHEATHWMPLPAPPLPGPVEPTT